MNSITNSIKNQILVVLLTSTVFFSCNRNNNDSDAYGNFESTEVIVSTGAMGKLISFAVSEGQQIPKGQVVGCIDTVQFHLKKLQLFASRKSIASKTGNIIAQIDVLKEQKTSALREKARFEKLVAQKAATHKQLDDINSEINVIDAQMTSIQTQNAAVLSEVEAIDVQVLQLDDQIQKSIINNPITGTVLVKYAEESEMVSFGKPLYKIANLDTMTLRAYVSGAQLPLVQIGQPVNVLIDNGENTIDTLSGKVSWIANTAEFTPKTIQTRDERVSLVYAVKVRVKNDGRLKIGMPGEIKLIKN